MSVSARPTLARRARLRFDRHGGGHLLLAPERGYRLSSSAAAIIQLCDGQHSVGEIARLLAPPQQEAQVLADVIDLLRKLQGRGLLAVTEP